MAMSQLREDNCLVNRKRKIRKKAGKPAMREEVYYEKKSGQWVRYIRSKTEKLQTVHYCHADPISGHLGVSCVVNQGVSPGYSITDFNITSMSVKNQDMKPPETKLLFLKENSLHFLFDPIWTLSGSQQGKYLHILNDAVEKLKPHIQCVVAINQVCDELIKLGSQSLGRVVVTTDVT